MSKAIYVAASSRELDLAERCMAELRKHGWTIAEDWCANMRRVGVPDHELTVEEQRGHARRNTGALRRSDVLWLLVPSRETPSDGAWFELGYVQALDDALPHRRRIVVSGRPSLFTSLAHERYATHEEALATLCLKRCACCLGEKR